MGAIPRAATCPSMPVQSGSPKSGSPRGLPTWRHQARRPSWQRLSGADAAQGLLGLPSGSRAILLAIAALYSVVILGLPVLYSAFGPQFRGSPMMASNSGDAVASSGSSDLPAAALAEGVLQAPQLAKALSSRRLALQTGAELAAADLWPDAGLAQRHFGTKTAQLPRVEYRDAGNVVSLIDALNISHWSELPLYHPNPLPPAGSRPATSPGSSASSSGSSSSDTQQPAAAASYPPACPQGEIRLFIGITSRCCTAEAQAKRDVIRRTWLRYTREHLPEVSIRFILAQPPTEADMKAAMELLRGEIQQHADIIIVPGQDLYRNLPSKTLQLFQYFLSSDCKFTHILKADDDVYLRPQMLMDIITQGRYDFSVEVQHDGSGMFDGKEAPFYQSPWMRGMYVGQLDSNKSGVFPGWSPNRDPKSKWYLSEQDLPNELAPLGVRWASGWGYMLSRDLAEFISNTALLYSAVPDKKPPWWGRMPWEDIMVGTLLKGVGRVHHHAGFKAAWQDCDKATVLKHLDYDAPALQEGLYVQERSGLWSKKSVVCSSGVFEPNNHSDWRLWRNSLPDNQLGGFM